MSDFLPKAGGVKVGGLSRKAQKLQALREKAANQQAGAKSLPGAATAAPVKARALAGTKKTSFQRKAT